MTSEAYAYPLATRGHPVFRTLAAFPVACFSGALLTDAAYWQTADMMWADFSAWLLAVGLAFGLLAAVAGLVAAATDRALRARRNVGLVALGGLVVLALALLDNLVHSRDAWTSVVPLGLALSVATVLAMLVTAGLGAARDRRPVADADADARYAGARP